MIVNYNGKDVKLPDFLIVGAAKSGTTSLHYYLMFVLADIYKKLEKERDDKGCSKVDSMVLSI